MAVDRILVLDADGRAGVACVQSLGRAGHRVHVAVRRRGSTTESSRWCHQVHPQPPAEPAQVGAAWLVDLDAHYAFTLVIATTEASLRWLRTLPQQHPVRRKAVLPSDDALDAALDKSVTAAIARELGLPVPNTRNWLSHELTRVQDANDERNSGRRFPVVLKPVRSKVVIGTRLASLSVAIVHDEQERIDTLASWLPHTPVQEQAWVAGRGVGVEVLYAHGRMAWHFVHERLHEWPLTGGASTLRRAGGHENELVEKTCRLLDRLQWHGVAMVEWRRDERGALHLMEINPRLWGSLPLTIAAGVNVPLGLLALARDEALAPARPWRVGMTARNLTEDLQWFIGNLRADRSDPLLLTEPHWRTAIGWLRLFSGREVWDGWSRRDPGVGLTELGALLRHRFGALWQRIDRNATLTRARARHRAMRDAQGALSNRPKSVLFLCLGNLCRSPFAAAVAAARLPDARIESAGFLHHDGRPSPQHVLAVAGSLGFDLSDARARRVTEQQIAQASLIVCMEVSHLKLMTECFPHAVGKSTLLGLFDPAGSPEIPDPYDMSPAATRAVFMRMLKAIDSLAALGAIQPTRQ